VSELFRDISVSKWVQVWSLGLISSYKVWTVRYVTVRVRAFTHCGSRCCVVFCGDLLHSISVQQCFRHLGRPFTGGSVSLFQVARDCADILTTGHMDSGLYTVHVNGDNINVYCDMSTEAGGWLVSHTLIDILRRYMSVSYGWK